MSAWYTKIRGVVERHDGRDPKRAAGIALLFAINHCGTPHSECGLYRRDPVKHPDEPNLLPAEMAKVARRRARGRS